MIKSLESGGSILFQLKLLIRAFAAKKRSPYVVTRVRQALLDIAEEGGVSLADLAEAARAEAVIEPVSLTVGAARKHPVLGNVAPLIARLEKFASGQKISGVVERFQTWPTVGGEALGGRAAIVLHATSTAFLWRLRLPDGTAANFTTEKFAFNGLAGKSAEKFPVGVPVPAQNVLTHAPASGAQGRAKAPRL